MGRRHFRELIDLSEPSQAPRPITPTRPQIVKQDSEVTPIPAPLEAAQAAQDAEPMPDVVTPAPVKRKRKSRARKG